MSVKYKFAILVSILIIATIGVFIKTDQIMEESENIRQQSEIVIFAQSLVPYYLSGNLEAVYKLSSAFGFNRIETIPKRAKILHQSVNEILTFKIFTYSSYIGFSLSFLGDNVHFVTKKHSSVWDHYKILILIFQLGIITLLVFFFFSQVLYPLGKLQTAINELKSGIYGKMLKIHQKDEIGELMNTFNQMNGKISRMIKARELITRNIAHELKTPLAKIKLALDLKRGEELKSDLKRYIDSLHRISQNMIEYEQIQDGNLKLKKDEFFSETLLFEALKDKDEDESKNIKLNIMQSVKIKGDLNLLSIAVKNLIENALKYSSDGIVSIEASENGIAFINKGEKLQKDISYYFEPFYRGDIIKSGYGLGLSIVSEIATLHQMKIEYQFDDGRHIFYLRF